MLGFFVKLCSLSHSLSFSPRHHGDHCDISKYEHLDITHTTQRTLSEYTSDLQYLL